MFVGLYALLGHIIFMFSFEYQRSFSSLPDSNYSMLILLTTANFPDIMLPAYSKNYWSCLFFVSYLIIGLYFVLNFLLANIFNKFKERLERKT